MDLSKFSALLVVSVSVSACVSAEAVRFRASPQQQAIVRDGVSALVSKKPNSLVLIRPATRTFAAGHRPVYVVGISNRGRNPIEFQTARIVVNQRDGADRLIPLKVVSYDELVQEERTRQIAAALIVGLAAGANSYVASRSGFATAQSTVQSGGRVSTVTTRIYSPGAAFVAQSNAAAENDAMISNAIEAGQRNLAQLEGSVIKDNTLMPGEWYGGQLHVQAPERTDGKPKSYIMEIHVGDDVHVIDVVQENTNEKA